MRWRRPGRRVLGVHNARTCHWAYVALCFLNRKGAGRLRGAAITARI